MNMNHFDVKLSQRLQKIKIRFLPLGAQIKHTKSNIDFLIKNEVSSLMETEG